MRPLTLVEYEWSANPIELTVAERDTLRSLYRAMEIRPAAGSASAYYLRPQSDVGAIRIGDLAIEIRPKQRVDLRRVLFLISYALDGVSWKEEEFDFTSDSLVEAIVPAFVSAVGRAFARGLLQGYIVEEDALLTVRGRVRFDDQIRTRFGRFPPVEVRFDEYTEDIEENRLILAAMHRLRRLRLRSGRSTRALGSFDDLLEHVSLIEYAPGHVPDPLITRLNRHYRPALALARLILHGTSLDLGHGGAAGTAFLVDMNVVFEEFVRTAIREDIGVDERAFPRGSATRGLYLDEHRRVKLEPDLSWWRAGDPVFVGDVKYKRTPPSGVLHPDLYQLLAYTVATNLPAGLLVYAAGEKPAIHRVVHLGKLLEVVALDLSGEPEEILADTRRIAARVRSLAKAGETRRLARIAS